MATFREKVTKICGVLAAGGQKVNRHFNTTELGSTLPIASLKSMAEDVLDELDRLCVIGVNDGTEFRSVSGQINSLCDMLVDIISIRNEGDTKKIIKCRESTNKALIAARNARLPKEAIDAREEVKKGIKSSISAINAMITVGESINEKFKLESNQKEVLTTIRDQLTDILADMDGIVDISSKAAVQKANALLATLKELQEGLTVGNYNASMEETVKSIAACVKEWMQLCEAVNRKTRADKKEITTYEGGDIEIIASSEVSLRNFAVFSSQLERAKRDISEYDERIRELRDKEPDVDPMLAGDIERIRGEIKELETRKQELESRYATYGDVSDEDKIMDLEDEIAELQEDLKDKEYDLKEQIKDARAAIAIEMEELRDRRKEDMAMYEQAKNIFEKINRQRFLPSVCEMIDGVNFNSILKILQGGISQKDYDALLETVVAVELQVAQRDKARAKAVADSGVIGKKIVEKTRGGKTAAEMLDEQKRQKRQEREAREQQEHERRRAEREKQSQAAGASGQDAESERERRRREMRERLLGRTSGGEQQPEKQEEKKKDEADILFQLDPKDL